MIIHDISVPLGGGSIDFPGDPPFRLEQISEAGRDAYALSAIHMSSHAGTHLDAPSHLFAGAAGIDQIAPGSLILPAKVVEFGETAKIGPAEVARADFLAGEAVLFKTDNSRRGIPRAGGFVKDYVFIGGEGARLLAARGPSLVGIDYVSVDPPGDDLSAHLALLGAGILVLEGIDLSTVPAGAYTLCCLPLLVRGAEAAPARALLIAGDWGGQALAATRTEIS